MLSVDSVLIIKNHLSGYKHHWLYTENGRPIMTVARYDTNQGKTYRQFHLADGVWEEGMPTSPYPLFGLDSLKNSSPFDAVLICEGEKCAAALHQLGWPAVAAVLGAQNPSHSDWSTLRHFNRFIILRDNDKAGAGFARATSGLLIRLRKDAEILVVNLMPNLAGGDLIDWLQQTVLRGAGWNGFELFPQSVQKSVIAAALQETIEASAIDVKDCPIVVFKTAEALFEGPPRMLESVLREVPIFPLEAFPPMIEEYLLRISEQFSQVPDFAATALITLFGGLVGRSAQLEMRPNSSWVEAANCWGVLVGSPAAKKSPIMRFIMKSLKGLEDQAAVKYRAALKAYKVREREAKENKEEFDEPPPIRRRYVSDDATTPKLRELMAGNLRGLILKSDELKGQLERLDKPGSEGDRSFMMTCWSGLEVYSEDRMCRESNINIPVALTWIGCIPPNALQKYLYEAIGRGGGADGFMQRFQFVSFPDQKMSYELPQHPLPKELEEEVQKLILKIDEGALAALRTLHFSPHAQERFNTWMKENENSARSGKHPPYWEAHLGKQAKVVAVLAIILHRLQEATSTQEGDQIDVDTLERVLVLQRYFEAHAKRCYESVSGGAVNDAKTIICLLKEKRLSDHFKAADIYRNGLGGLSDSVKVKEALELLQEYGWIALEQVRSKNGRPSEFWILNPRAFEKE